MQYGHTNDTSDMALSDLNERGENQYPKTLIVGSRQKTLGAPVRKFVGFLRHRGAAIKRNVIAGAGIRVPKLILLHDDTTGARYILIMEDLAPESP